METTKVKSSIERKVKQVYTYDWHYYQYGEYMLSISSTKFVIFTKMTIKFTTVTKLCNVLMCN